MKREEIKHVAELSRIELTPEEEIALEADFKKILSYIDQIQEVSGFVDATTDTTVGELRNVTRNDKAEDVLPSKEVTELFPKIESGYLAVKKVLQQ